MRGTVLLTLALAAAPLAAQGVAPPEVLSRATALINDPATERREGAAGVPAGEVVAGDLAVLDGDLALAGEVMGKVVVVNGTLTLAPGAAVAGGVLVIGGEVHGAGGARIGGATVAYPEPVAHCRRGGFVDLGGLCAALPPGNGDEGAEEEWTVDAPRRDLRFLLATGRSYNRVEGLPVRFGLGWESPSAHPTRVHVQGIYRTESGARLGPARWGYDVRVEQELGGRHGARLGVQGRSLVDAVEEWHVTDLENSLATFFLRRDFRDHYERRGWSAYAALEPAGSPWSGRVEISRERHGSLPAGSPWTLFDNDDPWRLQPLVGEGRLVAATLGVRADTRSEAWDPAAGWFLLAEVEQALSSSLVRPPFAEDGYVVNGAAADVAPSPPAEAFGRFTRVRVDVRRYNRISPSSRINLRAAGGGALGGGGLPPQRQHALGGEGTLPGYPLFRLDCGARDREGTRSGERYHPAYGCDRFLLAQVEYRSDLSLRVPLPREDGEPSELRADLTWVLFADAAAGWSVEDRLRDERAALDVGTGLQWRDFGVYLAYPVGARSGEGTANLFVRLAPRF
jgi:hypothetical protein